PSAQVDLVEDATFGEVLLLHRVPAAEQLTDGEGLDLGQARQFSSGHQLRTGRTVVVAGDDGLAFGGIQVVQIGLCQIGVALASGVVTHYGHRRFSEDGHRRYDDFERFRPQLVESQEGLVLQEISTSPMPRCTKVVVEPRAPVSSTCTLPKSAEMKSRAAFSSPPELRRA